MKTLKIFKYNFLWDSETNCSCIHPYSNCSYKFHSILLGWFFTICLTEKNNINRNSRDLEQICHNLPKIGRNWGRNFWSVARWEEGGYWAWAEREGGRRSEQHQQAVPHSLPPFLPSLIPLQALLFLYLSCRNLFPHPPLANTNTQNHEN